MAESIILSKSEYDRLLEEIHQIQARIIELTALRDDLLYHICPALKAAASCMVTVYRHIPPKTSTDGTT